MNKKILFNCINDVSYGGYTYWNNFISKLSLKNKKNLEIIFLCNRNTKLIKYLKNEKIIFVPKLVSNNFIIRFFYEQIYIPLSIDRKYNFDTYFNGKNIAPIFLLKKSIIVIRNIEPFFIQKNFISIRYYILVLKFILTVVSLKYCSKIITVSNNTFKIIDQYTNKKKYIIPNGVSVEKNFLKWKPNTNNPFILNSSKFVPYANQLKLLRIYNIAFKMNKKLPNLVLVGGVEDKHYFKKILKYISDNKLEKRIKILGYVSKNKLHEMMTKCKYFIFTSELESCPQTILEAKKIGCPILSSEIEPMPEFLGKYANYLDLKNEDKSATILNKLIKSEIIYKKYKEKKFDKAFDWSNVIDEYLKILTL